MKWNNIKKKKPQPCIAVLVHYKDDSYAIDFMAHNGTFIYENLYGPAVHWMPLKAPKIKEV